MRVLVCGGRDYSNVCMLDHCLTHMHLSTPITLLIEGGALGADRLGREWAIRNRVQILSFHAAWDKHGRRAGPLRNQRMIDEGKPDKVCAFPGGRGTADMVKRAKLAGIPVTEASE